MSGFSRIAGALVRIAAHFARENVWATGAAFATVVAAFFYYFDFQRSEPSLIVSLTSSAVNADLRSNGIGIEFEFNIVNKSAVDAIVERVNFVSLTGENSFGGGIYVGGEIVEDQFIIPARGIEKLRVQIVNPISSVFYDQYKAVLNDRGLISQSTPYDTPLEITDQQAQSILQEVWKNLHTNNFETVEDWMLPKFELFALTSCEEEFKDFPLVCGTVSLTTIEGNSFVSAPAMVGLLPTTDCARRENKKFCEVSPLAFDFGVTCRDFATGDASDPLLPTELCETRQGETP